MRTVKQRPVVRVFPHCGLSMEFETLLSTRTIETVRVSKVAIIINRV